MSLNSGRPDHQARKHRMVEALMAEMTESVGAGMRVLEGAKKLYHESFKSGLTMLKKNSLVAAVCVSLALTERGLPPDRGLVILSGVPRTRFRKYKREIATGLGLPEVACAERAAVLIRRFRSELGLPAPAGAAAARLLRGIMARDETFITNPLAAAITILFICDPEATLRGYARVACTVSTIRVNRARYPEFMRLHGIRVPAWGTR